MKLKFILAIVLLISLNSCANKDEKLSSNNETINQQSINNNDSGLNSITNSTSKESVKLDNDLGGKNVKRGGARYDFTVPQVALPDCAKIIIAALTKIPYVESISTGGSQITIVVSDMTTTQIKLEEAISNVGFSTKNLRYNPEAYSKLPAECKEGADVNDLKGKERSTEKDLLKDKEIKDSKSDSNSTNPKGKI